MTDEHIAALLVKDSRAALAEIDGKYRKRGEALAGRICNKEYAGEIFSDALMVLHKNAASVTGPSLGAFLLRTVRNLALKKREYLSAKKRGGDARELPLEEALFPSGENVSPESPEDLAEARETAAAVNSYLGGVSPDARKIFVCRCYFGMSVEETAKHLKVSQSKVKTSLSRTRSGIKEHLERMGLL